MSYTKRKLLEPGSTLETRSAQRLRKSAYTLSLASNPTRLRIIFRLAEGERGINELSEDLGLGVRDLANYVDALRRGGLVKSDGTKRHNCYDLTEVGFKTVRFISHTFGPIKWSEPLPAGAKTNRVGRQEIDRRLDEIEFPGTPYDEDCYPPEVGRFDGPV